MPFSPAHSLASIAYGAFQPAPTPSPTPLLISVSSNPQSSIPYSDNPQSAIDNLQAVPLLPDLALIPPVDPATSLADISKSARLIAHFEDRLLAWAAATAAQSAAPDLAQLKDASLTLWRLTAVRKSLHAQFLDQKQAELDSQHPAPAPIAPPPIAPAPIAPAHPVSTVEPPVAANDAPDDTEDDADDDTAEAAVESDAAFSLPAAATGDPEPYDHRYALMGNQENRTWAIIGAPLRQRITPGDRQFEYLQSINSIPRGVSYEIWQALLASAPKGEPSPHDFPELANLPWAGLPRDESALGARASMPASEGSAGILPASPDPQSTIDNSQPSSPRSAFHIPQSPSVPACPTLNPGAIAGTLSRVESTLDSLLPRDAESSPSAPLVEPSASNDPALENSLGARASTPALNNWECGRPRPFPPSACPKPFSSFRGAAAGGMDGSLDFVTFPRNRAGP